MLNKYLDRLERLVEEYQNQELPQFRGPDDKAAQWNDLIWFHIDPNTGRKTRFLCGKHGIKGAGNSGNKPEFALRPPYDQLIKVWIIETNNSPISADERQARVSYARYLLCNMRGDLYSQTSDTIAELQGKKRAESSNPFLAFCAEKGLMRPIRLHSNDCRDRTGHAQFDTKVQKLPEIEAILALGAIHHEIFQPVNQRGVVSTEIQINMMNALVATFGLLGLSAPNRIAAETPLLPKQRLKNYSESGGKPVHYLDWAGSKGFKDNRNHVLAALADEVDRAVNFFFIICEPARILCKFYVNPKQSLGVLVGDFKVQEDRRRHLKFDEAPNLFVLGYALGLYPVDACVPVILPGVDLPSLAHNHPRYRACFKEKPIYSLQHDDRLATSTTATGIASIPFLFDYQSIRGKALLALGCGDKSVITLGELQDNWIGHVKTHLIPSFPYSYSNGEGKIKLTDALFCLHGHHLYGRVESSGSGGKPLAQSPYAIVPLGAIASHVTTRFTGSSGSNISIFDEFGFEGMRVNAHSLRHFGNTLAELSEIPREIITTWSGRKDKEQTDTYLHSTHHEQAGRVRAVLSKPEHDKREIKVVAQEAILQATNLPASITSTGVCTQELNLNPCEYLNDFVSQCFMCSAACHVVGDTKTIQFFEKDYEIQATRLELTSNDQRLSNSIAMQRWFVIHSRNTHVLASLIEFMKTLKPGTVIRYSPKASEFYFTDAGMKKTRKTPCLIPDFEDTLQSLLANQASDRASNTNPELHALLSSFGLSEETV